MNDKHARTHQAPRTHAPAPPEESDAPPAPLAAPEEDPDLSHNAHPLAIRKAVAEAERAAQKAAKVHPPKSDDDA
jgi:hypothetical protein